MGAGYKSLFEIAVPQNASYVFFERIGKDAKPWMAENPFGSQLI
jgi:hypothetical protein